MLAAEIKHLIPSVVNTRKKTIMPCCHLSAAWKGSVGNRVEQGNKK